MTQINGQQSESYVDGVRFKKSQSTHNNTTITLYNFMLMPLIFCARNKTFVQSRMVSMIFMQKTIANY
jgi:hypothetical protein